MRSFLGSMTGIACLAVLLVFHATGVTLPTGGAGWSMPVEAREVRVTRRAALMPLPRIPDGSVAFGRTQHFDFYTDGAGIPASLPALQAASEQVHAAVTARFGVDLQGRIAVVLKPPRADECGLRGSTKLDAPTINIMVDDRTSVEQYLGVLAHELGHVVELFAFDANPLGDVVLLEAVATWGAGEFWNTWHERASFDSSVTDAIAAGQRVVLQRPTVKGLNGVVQIGLRDECERDLFYTQWAAFVDDLVTQHGLDSVVELMTRPAIPMTDGDGGEYARADFASILGRPLPVLADAWLQEMR